MLNWPCLHIFSITMLGFILGVLSLVTSLRPFPPLPRPTPVAAVRLLRDDGDPDEDEDEDEEQEQERQEREEEEEIQDIFNAKATTTRAKESEPSNFKVRITGCLLKSSL